MRALAVLVLPFVVAAGCTVGTGDDAGPDAAVLDASRADASDGRDAEPPDPLCACTSGLHTERIFLVGDTGELWTYDPVADAFEYLLGPVCALADRPFAMAIDPSGRAFVQYIEMRRLFTIDVNALSACLDSGYLPTEREFPLFGMTFVQPEGECATMFALAFSGSAMFSEGPGVGGVGVIDGDPLRLRRLATIDYDGGDLAGTGDGRLFAFAGAPHRLG